MPRIIAGTLGGRTLPSPPGKGTRPTTDRVREALFSRLETWDAIADARVLDLYAGTGALALEALSRGARSALLVDAHGPTAKQLRRTITELGLVERAEVRAAKAETVAGELAGKDFSLVFIDPPYDATTPALETLLVTLRPALREDALVVIERSTRTPAITWPPGWTEDGAKSYGETALQYGGPDARAEEAEESAEDSSSSIP